MVKKHSWSAMLVVFASILTACGGATLDGASGGLLGGDGGGSAGLPAKLTVTSSQASAFADGTSAVLISAVLTDADDVPVPQRALTFTTTAGTLLAGTGTTNADGLTQVFLRAPVQQGTATIIAREAKSGVSGATTVEFLPGLTDALTGELTPVKLAPRAVASFTVTALDASRNPVPGQTITFDTLPFGAGGTFTPVAIATDENGRATSTFEVGQGTGVFTLRGRTAGGLEATAQLTVATQGGLLLSVTPSQPAIPADGQSTVVISAVLTDENETPRAGRTIEFSTNAGRFVAASDASPTRMNATTDSNGRAEVTLRSSAIRGIATVTARETGVDVTGATAVRFENGAATQLTTMLEALRIGTRETTQFIATAIDSNGNPVEGEAIAFDVVSGAGAFAESSVITDSNGRAIGNFTAGPSAETVTLRARTAGGLSSSAQLTVGVAALTVLSSSPVLVSSADTQDEGVTISAQVRDGSNVLQEGISVTFSSDSGALQVVNGETDASGTARATLITAGDPSNRRINVIATAEGRSNTVAVDVIGTRLTLDGPRAIQNGVANSYVVTLLDSSGAPVALRSVAFSAKGATLSGTTLTTDAQGRGTVQLTATAGLTARLTATALGASVSVDISVTNDSLVFVPPTGAVGCTNPKPFARLGDIPVNANRTIRALWCRLGEPVVGQPVTFTTTRGAFGGSSSVTANTGADGIASVVIRAAQAGRATVQAVGNDPNPDPTRTGEPASTPFSTIDGEFVAKVPASVDVQADPSVIGVEQESTITAVVRDAANNLVKNSTVNFTLNDVTGGTLSAGAAVTDSQGRVSVVYRASATTSGQGGVRIIATVSGTTITDEARLTVGGQTLRIVLGTGNELFESDDTTRYEVPYTALVTDSAGNPVPGAVLSMTGFPEKYLKGFYPGVPGAWVRTVTAICDNEDKNENGILDPGEDTNNNGILDPANVATVPFQPPVDGTGIASFRIVYPQDRGNWIDDFRLSARARVAGTEATEIVRFPLPISADDATGEGSPPGAISPFGIIGRCDLTDNQVPRVTIAAASTTQVVAESAGIVQITVRVDRAFNEDILVPIDVGLAGDTATPGIDYEAPPSVRIPAGSISGTFNVKVLADSESEGDEIATFSLGTPLTNNALLSNVTAASLIITDVSDSQPRVSISPVDQGVISVSSAVGSFPIRVRMDNVASQDVLIPISVGGASDSAESGQDFSAATSVRIPAGSRSATFPIQIFQDGDSNDEIFTVTLGEASSGNARLGAPVSTRVIIVVDNQLPRVSIPAAGRNRTVAENAGTVSITVRMDRTATTDVRVPVFFGSEEDTATICDPTSVRCNDQPGTGDYSAAASDIVRIPAGSTSGTLVVSIHDDSTDENNESFTLTLGDPLDGNALLLNRDASRISRVVITDNDLPPTPSP